MVENDAAPKGASVPAPARVARAGEAKLREVDDALARRRPKRAKRAASAPRLPDCSAIVPRVVLSLCLAPAAGVFRTVG